MALRPVSSLGLADATDLTPPAATAAAAAPSALTEVAVVKPRKPRRSPSRAPRSRSEPAPDPPSEPAVPPLGDEAAVFLQIMVPGELHERLADVSHLLAAEHRKLRHQKTIIGALLWRYVDPDDRERLAALGETLDAYLATELAEVPSEIKVGANLPFSLKYQLDGAALALRRTRRAASAKTLLSALIWRHVERDDLAELVDLLAAYHQALQPTLTPLYRPDSDGSRDDRGVGAGLEPQTAEA